jgi:glycosyltransferase involved in cell wall biosynthesis
MPGRMHVVQVSAAWDPDLDAPEALLARYDTLAAWSAALLAAGAERATVVQRFARDAELTRGGVRFLFRRDGTRPFPRPWARLARLASTVAACGADVVHVNGLLFPAATRRLRRVLPRSTALVVQDHASAGPPRDPARRALWRFGLRGVDAFLFTAGEQAEPWRRAGLLGATARVETLPEASRALGPLPRDAAREACGLRGDPAVLWVGHLDANKDPLTVLEGFAGALEALPGAVLTFVFRGDELRRAVQACLGAAVALRAHVELRGAVAPADVAALYSAADLFVLGSRREGSGYALIEALACGALPVVSDIPPFRALTAGGRLGAPRVFPPLLWRAGDARALREALVRAARLTSGAAAEREAVRAAVRAHFERELSWPAVATRALAAYRAAVERRRGRQGSSA